MLPHQHLLTSQYLHASPRSILQYLENGAGAKTTPHCYRRRYGHRKIGCKENFSGTIAYTNHTRQLAVEIARKFNGEIINGDAMQLYHGLPVITNKITTEETKGVPHHLLGCIGLEEETWTVGKFVNKALGVVSISVSESYFFELTKTD